MTLWRTLCAVPPYWSERGEIETFLARIEPNVKPTALLNRLADLVTLGLIEVRGSERLGAGRAREWRLR